MNTPLSRKERSHRRIVDAAARAIRRDGYAGVGVADVMREAGLTHGGFYAHFASREALLVEAVAQAGRSSAALMAARTEAVREEGGSAFRALVEGYLADGLLDAADAGCPVAALCAEIPRQAPEVRKASSARVEGLIRYVGRTLPPSIPPSEAPVVAATLIGSLQIARAVEDREAGRALLEGARTALLDRYDR